MSFANKAIRTANKPINFIFGTDALGRDIYCFIQCSKQKFDSAMNSIGKGKINLHDYGVVLAAGFGKTPSAPVVALLKEKYGYDASHLG